MPSLVPFKGNQEEHFKGSQEEHLWLLAFFAGGGSSKNTGVLGDGSLVGGEPLLGDAVVMEHLAAFIEKGPEEYNSYNYKNKSREPIKGTKTEGTNRYPIY